MYGLVYKGIVKQVVKIELKKIAGITLSLNPAGRMKHGTVRLQINWLAWSKAVCKGVSMVILIGTRGFFWIVMLKVVAIWHPVKDRASSRCDGW